MIPPAARAVVKVCSTLLLAVGLTSAGNPDDDPPPADEPIVVSIDRLTSIKYVEGKKLPSWVRDLDGKRIKIEGYMALGTLEGVKTFELVPEACECGRAKVQHFIDVTLEEGLTTFRPGRIELEGVFRAGALEEDGFVVSIFRLEIQSLDE